MNLQPYIAPRSPTEICAFGYREGDYLNTPEGLIRFPDKIAQFQIHFCDSSTQKLILSVAEAVLLYHELDNLEQFN